MDLSTFLHAQAEKDVRITFLSNHGSDEEQNLSQPPSVAAQPPNGNAQDDKFEEEKTLHSVDLAIPLPKNSSLTEEQRKIYAYFGSPPDWVLAIVL